MVISFRVRTGIVTTLVILGACRDTPRSEHADTVPTHVTEMSARAVAAASFATNRTTMPAPRPPRAGDRPGLVIGRTTVWLDSTLISEVGAAFGARSIVGDGHPTGWVLEACYSAGADEDRMTVLSPVRAPGKAKRGRPPCRER
jgi:hypothetical protein